MSVIDSSEPISLPAPSKPTREAKLLVQEASEYLADVPQPFQRGQRTPRVEPKRRIRNYTAERLMREEPRRYRLIASMRQEGLGIRQTCRAAHCDARTVDSVVRHANQSVTTLKPKLTRGFGELARMSLERLQEEVPTMNQAQLAVTAGIATDKFINLTGDPNLRIEHTIKHQDGNIFDRMNNLKANVEKIISAKIVEPLQIESQ